MIFRIDPATSKPVYQQIIDQVKYAVATGRLVEGDRLEPIRDVAVQTRVNRNTIARAYLELEREGLIRTRAGQGSFICGEAPAPAASAPARSWPTPSTSSSPAPTSSASAKTKCWTWSANDWTR